MATTDVALAKGEKFIDKHVDDFAAVLPSHLDGRTFARLAVGVLRKNQDVREAAAANPASLWHALMECSRLGHEPGTEQFALVKFNSKDAPGGMEVVGIEQYQGEIERMYRASIPGEFGVQAIRRGVVREKDLYIPADESETGRPIHKRGWWTTDPPGESLRGPFTRTSERGAMIGVYAYAELAGGAVSAIVEMDEDTVNQHKAKAKTQKFWVDWPEQMWIKTAIHELETWVPTSSEYRRQAMAAAAKRLDRDKPIETDADEAEGVVEAVVVEDVKP